MAVVAGRVLPNNKHVCIALTAVFGIGRNVALDICAKTDVPPVKKVKEMDESELESIRNIIADNYVVEGDLRREIATNIKQLKDKGCYRGVRHRRGLPVHGQRTRTNARTRKGRKK